MGIEIPVDAEDAAEDEAVVRTDGGSPDDPDAGGGGGSLGFAGEEVASRGRSVLDAVSNRVVFAGGAAAGSVVTLLAVFAYATLF
jgi:hypothetical protein